MTFRPAWTPAANAGEFHTFVWDAPMFSSPIAIRTGETVTRDGFVFCDVVPADGVLRTSRGPSPTTL